jgi:hypothetical protein
VRNHVVGFCKEHGLTLPDLLKVTPESLDAIFPAKARPAFDAFVEPKRDAFIHVVMREQRQPLKLLFHSAISGAKFEEGTAEQVAQKVRSISGLRDMSAEALTELVSSTTDRNILTRFMKEHQHLFALLRESGKAMHYKVK